MVIGRLHRHARFIRPMSSLPPPLLSSPYPFILSISPGGWPTCAHLVWCVCVRVSVYMCVNWRLDVGHGALVTVCVSACVCVGVGGFVGGLFN